MLSNQGLNINEKIIVVCASLLLKSKVSLILVLQFIVSLMEKDFAE